MKSKPRAEYTSRGSNSSYARVKLSRRLSSSLARTRTLSCSPAISCRSVSEMCTSPSTPSATLTKVPNLARIVTTPSSSAPALTDALNRFHASGLLRDGSNLHPSFRVKSERRDVGWASRLYASMGRRTNQYLARVSTLGLHEESNVSLRWMTGQ
jgi:3-methyladenine DNA glycosylase AlkC